ncbi:MAG: hypothetical protein LC772_12475, partial [Chloroflexi bacterium]|nr:hypothetical protein [Chloroflexota bacterium]
MRQQRIRFVPAVTMLVIAATGAPAAAQVSPAAPPENVDLAAALAAARPAAGVALSVDAQSVTLPANAPPPGPGASWEAVGAAYGRLVKRFGSVAAVAPPTMTLLNSAPQMPDLATTISSGTALQILLGELMPEQWQKLTSAAGLGYADLVTHEQQALFHTALPPGRINWEQTNNDYPT